MASLDNLRAPMWRHDEDSALLKGVKKFTDKNGRIDWQQIKKYAPQIFKGRTDNAIRQRLYKLAAPAARKTSPALVAPPADKAVPEKAPTKKRPPAEPFAFCPRCGTNVRELSEATMILGQLKGGRA